MMCDYSNEKEALQLLKRATAIPGARIDYHDESESVQRRLHKCLKLWSLYADLEESLGTFQSCKAVYDRIVDLRIATPQIIINYGMFLQVCIHKKASLASFLGVIFLVRTCIL